MKTQTRRQLELKDIIKGHLNVAWRLSDATKTGGEGGVCQPAPETFMWAKVIKWMITVVKHILGETVWRYSLPGSEVSGRSCGRWPRPAGGAAAPCGCRRRPSWPTPRPPGPCCASCCWGSPPSGSCCWSPGGAGGRAGEEEEGWGGSEVRGQRVN